MPAPRQRSQLTIQASPALLGRLRALAAARRQTLTAMVGEALEALVEAPPADPRPGRADAAAAAGDLLQRIEALDRRVAALEARPAPSAPSMPAARPTAPAAAPAAASAAALPDGGITARELARLAGVDPSGLNRWASVHQPGDVWQHPTAGIWRLFGKVVLGTGGTGRWVWLPGMASDGQA